MQISNSNLLITGANRGIGRALVTVALERGAKKIYAAARNQASLTTLVDAAPDRVVPVALDITKPEQVEAALEMAADVDLLINNAGALDMGSLLSQDLSTIRKDMETNYFGTLQMVRAFAPPMAARKTGAIVNFLSIVSLANFPIVAGYSASKAAALSLTQGLRAELKPQGITVHGVFPGPVDTDMAKEVPLEKATPQSVAHAVFEGIERGAEDIFPDAMAEEVQATWQNNPKTLEHQFAAMAAG